MSVSCFACAFVCARSWVVELKPKVCRGSMHTNDRHMLCRWLLLLMVVLGKGAILAYVAPAGSWLRSHLSGWLLLLVKIMTATETQNAHWWQGHVCRWLLLLLMKFLHSGAILAYVAPAICTKRSWLRCLLLIIYYDNSQNAFSFPRTSAWSKFAPLS